MAPGREYGAAIFSPGLQDVLLIKQNEESGWAFPFAHTDNDVHVVAAASAVRQLLGIDIGDKISRNHWIEVEFPQTGALVRLYMALGIKPECVTPCCAAGVVAGWHPLRSILPPVNAILRADNGSTGGATTAGAGEDEEGGSLLLEAGIAPFLAKLKALLNKHPEWRISQLDPHLMGLIQAAITLPPTQQQQPQQQPQQQERRQEQSQQESGTQAAGPQSQCAVLEAQPTETDAQEGQPGEGAQGPHHLGQQQDQDRDRDHQKRPSEAAAGDGGTEAGSGEAAAATTRPDEQREVDDPPREGAEARAGEAQPGGGEPLLGEGTSAGTAGRDDGSVPGAGEAATGPGSSSGGEAEGSEANGWLGPRPQEHLLEFCRMHDLPEPCYSLVVKKSARRPLVTASCILSHLGVTITPDMHVPGGIQAACQAAALAALLWLEGALPPDGGEAVRVVPVGWPPLLSEARGESWEATQAARRAGGARREVDSVQREALLREMDKKRQRLVEEAAELERLMAALRGGEPVPEPDISRLAASLGLGGSAIPSDGGLTTRTPAAGSRGSKRSADGGDLLGDGTGGLTVGLRALQFRSSSDSLGTRAAGGGRGPGGGRAPGTKRPREDGAPASSPGGEGAGGLGAGSAPNKNVVMVGPNQLPRRDWGSGGRGLRSSRSSATASGGRSRSTVTSQARGRVRRRW